MRRGKTYHFNKLAIILFLISIVVAAVLINDVRLAEAKTDKQHPRAQAGVLDLREWDFREDGILEVRGEWEMYWYQLLTPQEITSLEISTEQAEKTYMLMPSSWKNQTWQGEYLDNYSYGTVRLTILLPDNVTYPLGLKYKTIGSASKLWIDGDFIRENGKLSLNNAEHVPKFSGQEVYFLPQTNKVELVYQMVNHYTPQARLNLIYLGTDEQITNRTMSEVIKNSIVFGGLMLIAIYYGVLYFIQRRNKAALYLALSALIIAIRQSIVSERIVDRIPPDVPSFILTKLGFLPVFVLVPLIVLYIGATFSTPAMDRAARASFYASFVLVGVIFFLPYSVFFHIFKYGQVFVFMVAFYFIFMMVREGFFRDKLRATLMASATFILFIGAVNDYLRELRIIETPELLSVGMLIFVLSQALFLAWRYNEDYEKTIEVAAENERMYQIMEIMNEQLEDKVQERTKELEVANLKLDQLSRIDPLTGLANRRDFDERIIEECVRTQRNKQPLSVLMIDVDCFKPYNDNNGHQMGDNCLQHIAAAISSGINRSQDFVARYGGEEFIVILPNTNKEGAIIAAERIRRNVEDLNILHEFSIVDNKITISIGVYTEKRVTKDECGAYVHKADEALYAAKAQGRNQVVHHDNI